MIRMHWLELRVLEVAAGGGTNFSPSPPSTPLTESSPGEGGGLEGGEGDETIGGRRPILLRATRLADNVMTPWSVNLLALLNKFNRHWRTLMRSACIVPVSSEHSTTNRFFFRSSSGRMTSLRSRTNAGTSKVSKWTSILPASILEMSRMSLISSSKYLP